MEKPDIRQTVLKTVDELLMSHFGQTKAGFPNGMFSYQEIAGSRTLRGGVPETANHVFLHGLPLTSDSWAPLLNILDCNPLLADLPGVSRSTSRFDVRPADWMTILCSDLTTDPVIVAHSLGTTYALEYAAAYPSRVKALVLIAPYFLQKPAARSIKFRFSHEEVRALLTDEKAPAADVVNSTYHNFKIPGMLMRAGKILRQTRKSRHRTKYQALLQELNIPVLIITGSQDPLIERPGAIPVTEIKGAGHFPQITHTQEVAKIVQNFTYSLTEQSEKISA